MPAVPPLRRMLPGWSRVRSKEEGERTSDKEEMGKGKREKWRRNRRREKEARKKEKGMKGI